jgi:hypothetical protein
MNNGVLTLNQCTLSGNLATNISLGGVGIVNAGTLTLSNSIVAGNNAQGIAGDILNTSALTYAGSNIVSKLSGSFTGPTANTNAPAGSAR